MQNENVTEDRYYCYVWVNSQMRILFANDVLFPEQILCVKLHMESAITLSLIKDLVTLSGDSVSS